MTANNERFDPTTLDGLLAEGNAEVLYELAARVRSDLAIVEVGAFRGASAVSLALGAMSGNEARVWSVDPWDLPGNAPGRDGRYVAAETKRRYEEQLVQHGVRGHVTTIQAFSVDAASRWAGPEIGLLFIDGDHSYKAIQADMAAWFPYLAEDHVVAYDDYATKKNPGVAQSVDELGATGRYNVEIRGSCIAVATPVR